MSAEGLRTKTGWRGEATGRPPAVDALRRRWAACATDSVAFEEGLADLVVAVDLRLEHIKLIPALFRALQDARRHDPSLLRDTADFLHVDVSVVERITARIDRRTLFLANAILSLFIKPEEGELFMAGDLQVAAHTVTPSSG